MNFGDSAIVLGDEPPPWRRIRAAVDGYASAIVPLIGESYGPDCMQRAWREFAGPWASAVDPWASPADPLTGPVDPRARDTTFNVDDPHAELFFSWLFHSWAPRATKGYRLADPRLYGVAPTRAYLAANARVAANAPGVDPLLREYLEACLVAPLRFYEILDCRPGVGFGARDLLGAHELEVDEALASLSLSSGEIVFARLPSVDRIVLVDAISPFSFPATYAARVGLYRGRGTRKPTDLLLRKMYFELLETYLRSAQVGGHGHH